MSHSLFFWRRDFPFIDFHAIPINGASDHLATGIISFEQFLTMMVKGSFSIILRVMETSLIGHLAIIVIGRPFPSATPSFILPS